MSEIIFSYVSFRATIICLLLGLVISCKTANYQEAHETWTVQRRAALLAPDGWISLVGLYWLQEGASTFGSDSSLTLPFPAEAAPQLGTFYVEEGEVRVAMAADVNVQVNGETVSDATLSGRTVPALMSYGPLQWYLIERSGQFGIRLRDTTLPSRVLLEAIPRYDFARQWRKKAQYIPFASPKTKIMRNVLDMDIEVNVPGVLEFLHAGATHRLEVMDGGPDDFFLVFSDHTTGNATYGGGRYMYVARPDASGETIIDFNRAYNPPCVFTDYATCLLPNPENELPFAVPAGEKIKTH